MAHLIFIPNCVQQTKIIAPIITHSRMLDNPEKYAGLVPFGCRMEERFVWWYPLCYAWADI